MYYKRDTYPGMTYRNVSQEDDECESGMASEGRVNLYATTISGQTLPGAPLSFILTTRRSFGALYLIMGLVSFVTFFTGDDTCTQLSRQVTAPHETVGRADMLAVSKKSIEICPLLANSATMVLVGVALIVTTLVDYFKEIIVDSLNKHNNPILWAQLTFQGAMIVMIVFPLAGIVNVYELLFATVLSGTEFSIVWMSGEVNSAYFCKRDFLKMDSMYGSEFPKADKEQSMYGPYFRTRIILWQRPIFTALAVHAIIWIIGLIHLVQSEMMKDAKTEAGFVILFIFVFVLFTFLPVSIVLYIYDVQWFCQYRNINVFVDAVLFLVHAIIFITFLTT